MGWLAFPKGSYPKVLIADEHAVQSAMNTPGDSEERCIEWKGIHSSNGRFRPVLVAVSVFILAVCSLCSAAEFPPAFRWATQSHGKSGEFCSVSALSVDREHCSYVGGRFAGEIQLDWVVFKKTNFFHSPRGAFVAKYDASGNLVWVIHEERSGVESNGVTTDAQQNVYVIFHQNYTAFFLAKYDSEGKPLWAKEVAHAHQIATAGLKVDGAGDCYWAGMGYLGATIGNVDFDFGNFVAKFDSEGNQKWLRRPIGQTSSPVFGMDASGHCFLAGKFGGPIKIGTNTLWRRADARTNAAGDVFLAKYAPNGELLWAKQGGGDGSGWTSGLTVDPNGNCVLLGAYRGVVEFGRFTLDSHSTNYCTILASYDPEGEVRWAQTICDNSPAPGRLGGDIAGNRFVLIECANASFSIAKYDTGGNVLWTKPITLQESYNFRLVTDSAGYCFINGGFQAPGFTLDQFTLRCDVTPRSSTEQMFLAMLDTTSSPWQGLPVQQAKPKRPAGPPVFYMGPAAGFHSSSNNVATNAAARSTVPSSNGVPLPTSRGKMTLHLGQQ